jgi:predicted DNA-binding protein
MPAGRPRKDPSEKFAIAQISMPPELLVRLDLAAWAADETRSGFVRAAIELELKRLEQQRHSPGR